MGLEQIFASLRIALFGLNVLVALIYSIPIIFIRRFRHRNNILTLNICIATILCCFYWFIIYTMLQVNLMRTYLFMVNSCRLISIVSAVVTVEIPLSFITVSIHRLCCVVYHNKDLFKTKKWVGICILGQWILGIVCMLPILPGIQLFCVTSRWVEIYKMVLIIIIPFIVFSIVNILIFINVHSSTRRVQPSPSTMVGNNSRVIKRKMINGRDLHLLRHMVIMLSIFLGGWTPLYVLLAIQNQLLINPVLIACFTIWCQLALLCDIIDLYLYNHEIRNYLKTSFIRCFR